MKTIPVLAALLAAAVSLSSAFAAERVLPVPKTVDEARKRLQYLAEQSIQVDQWIDNNRDAEFARRYPALSRAPKGPGESVQAYREREMRNRIAVAQLTTQLRGERKEWLENQRRAVLALEIREQFPVRLGPYDADRAEYPLLLGFGWPAGLAVKLKVTESQKDVYAAKFPRSVSAVFRINEAGEAFLLSIDKEALKANAVVSIAQKGPSLLWRGAHESWVTAVSFRQDGAQAVSGGGDGALCAWDAETGDRIWRLPDVEMAMSLAHGPDLGVFATGGADSILRMREARTGREIWRGQASGMIFSVAFSPDGRFAATGDDGGSLRVWNAESGREVVRTDLDASIRSIAYSPDGRSIAAGSEGGFVVLWEVASGRQLWRTSFEGPVYSVSVGPRGDLVAAGGGGGVVRVLRASDGSDVWSRKADGEVRAIRFDPSGRLLAYGGAGYSARVVLAETGEPLWAATIGSPVRALDFGPQGTKLVVGSADFSVRLFAVDEGDRVQAAFSSYGKIYVEREDAARLLR